MGGFPRDHGLLFLPGCRILQTPTRYEKQKARYSFSISLCGAL